MENDHKLIIDSLRDTKARCLCGWNYTTISSDSETDQEIRSNVLDAYQLHIKASGGNIKDYIGKSIQAIEDGKWRNWGIIADWPDGMTDYVYVYNSSNPLGYKIRRELIVNVLNYLKGGVIRLKPKTIHL
jgi:hypothetical protein